MILSVSRRTDIPAFYSDWFMNRLKEEVVMVRNPMNYHGISKINLSPNVVDCIVFWTKNPQPMFKYLDEIEKKYKFYFQYTVNAYEKDMEPNLPNLDERLKNFIYLSERYGKERVIWRYDPIVITTKYSLEWHIKKFEYIASKLRNYTKTCVFSFLDIYDKNRKNLSKLEISNINQDTMVEISKKIKCSVTLMQPSDDCLVRVATTVRNFDNTRAIGTIIDRDSEVYKKVVDERKIYYGRAFVINRRYVAVYKPIMDETGFVDMVLYLGVPEQDTHIDEKK